MKAAVSIATTSFPSPHIASKIRKGRWTTWESKIRTGDKLYKELARLNLGRPSDDDRKSTYALMIGEIPKQEEDLDLYSLLNRCIDFGEAAVTPAKNGAVPAPGASIPSPSVPNSESDVHKITASVVPPSSSSKMEIEMDVELGMTLDDILLA